MSTHIQLKVAKISNYCRNLTYHRPGHVAGDEVLVHRRADRRRRRRAHICGWALAVCVGATTPEVSAQVSKDVGERVCIRTVKQEERDTATRTRSCELAGIPNGAGAGKAGKEEGGGA